MVKESDASTAATLEKLKTVGDPAITLFSASNESSCIDVLPTATSYDPYPELVEISGALWKRADAGEGRYYYFNVESKETVWTLPKTDYFIIDPSTGEKMRPAPRPDDASLSASPVLVTAPEEVAVTAAAPVVDAESAASAILPGEEVPGHAFWRKITNADGVTYYYNTQTQETAWTI